MVGEKKKENLLEKHFLSSSAAVVERRGEAFVRPGNKEEEKSNRQANNVDSPTIMNFPYII